MVVAYHDRVRGCEQIPDGADVVGVDDLATLPDRVLHPLDGGEAPREVRAGLDDHHRRLVASAGEFHRDARRPHPTRHRRQDGSLRPLLEFEVISGRAVELLRHQDEGEGHEVPEAVAPASWRAVTSTGAGPSERGVADRAPPPPRVAGRNSTDPDSGC